MEPIISGIQQLGVGIPHVHEAWAWYSKHFGMQVKIFDDAGTAAQMLPYTGGKPRRRHAILAINMQGGGGFEIWQYKSRKPQPAAFQIQAGDLGIYAGKIKTRDAGKTYKHFQAAKLDLISTPQPAPDGTPHFYVRDPYKNIFDVVESKTWFADNKNLTGGSYGAVMGVSDIDRALPFYAEVLGYDETIYDKTGTFDDLQHLPGGKGKFRRVLLRHSKPRKGAFSRILGPSEMELLAAQDRTPKKIFENRYWGDLGFIHICFDVKGADAIKEKLIAQGRDFTVDTGASFDMGNAAGRFSYAEDPDGSLFEFVETYKVPIWEKMGWYLNLSKRNPEKPLPNWMIRALGWF